MDSYDVVVIGGGISGLSVGHGLRRRGLDVLLLEAGDAVGGTLRSDITAEGFVLDCGPNTVTSRDPALFAEFAELGLDWGRLEADRRGARRYILLDGKPQLIPTRPQQLFASPLLSPTAKLRLLAEPLLPRTAASDESVRAFFARRLGPEPAARLVDPFVSGVYGGDPDATSMQAAFPTLWAAEQRAGSLLVGMLTASLAGGATRGRGAPRQRSLLFSFAEGLGAWPAAYARALGPERVWAGARATELRPVDGSWHLGVLRGGKLVRLEAEQVVIATPADVAAALLERIDAEGARALCAIPYAPISVVHLGYERQQVAHPLDGFGLLCPAVERRRLLGILWPSSLFPKRAPEGAVLTTSFVGGARMPGLARLDDSELLALVRAEHEALLGARGAPLLARITRWERGIPQYVAGHERITSALEEFEQRRRGLFLLGNYRGGVSVEKCWRNGAALAARIAERKQIRQTAT